MAEIYPQKLQKVEFAISRLMRVSISDIRDGGRLREFVHARKLVWAVARNHFGYTYPYLARFYAMDHSTVIHGVDSIMGTDDYHTAVQFIRDEFPTLLKTGDKGVDNA